MVENVAYGQGNTPLIEAQAQQLNTTFIRNYTGYTEAPVERNSTDLHNQAFHWLLGLF